jgi:hypothetical protein
MWNAGEGLVNKRTVAAVPRFKFDLKNIDIGRIARIYFAFSVVFFVTQMSAIYIFGDGIKFSLTFISSVSSLFNAGTMGIVLVLIVVQALFKTLQLKASTLLAAGYLLCAQVIFFSAFHAGKLLIPIPAGFWADPLFHQIDLFLHGGRTAFAVYSQYLSLVIPDRLVVIYYFPVWVSIAYAFPIFVVVFEHDHQRSLRFLILYAVAWILLGNILALAFASAGPIYFNHVTGLADFNFLIDFQQSHASVFGPVTDLQERLWRQHVEGVLGTGVSAFPSLHVAAATVPFLYFFDKWRWWALPLVLHPLLVQYGSVRTGFHYAVDGYFSILAMVLLHVALKRAFRLGSIPAVAAPALP